MAGRDVLFLPPQQSLDLEHGQPCCDEGREADRDLRTAEEYRDDDRFPQFTQELVKYRLERCRIVGECMAKKSISCELEKRGMVSKFSEG